MANVLALTLARPDEARSLLRTIYTTESAPSPRHLPLFGGNVKGSIVCASSASERELH